MGYGLLQVWVACGCISKSVAYKAVMVSALMLWIGCGVLGRWQMGRVENIEWGMGAASISSSL